jgi:MioC protein
MAQSRDESRNGIKAAYRIIEKMNIEILVASMTGNALMVAQELDLTYSEKELRLAVRMMDDLRPSSLARDGIYLICTSTYGQGDVPDNGRDFYEALCAERPELRGIRYGVVGLGDRTYLDTFNFGGRRFDTIFSELGANRIGERLQIDASEPTLPEDVALAWMIDWLAALKCAPS